MSHTHIMLLARRAMTPGPQLMKAMHKWAGDMYVRMVENQMRWDEVMFEEALCFVSAAYQRVTRFALAHVLGPVWGQTLKLRRAQCLTCEFRNLDSNGIARCHGHPTKSGTCNCPKWRWWIFSWLWWQILMCRNRVCPQGRFGRTDKPVFVQMGTPEQAPLQTSQVPATPPAQRKGPGEHTSPALMFAESSPVAQES